MYFKIPNEESSPSGGAQVLLRKPDIRGGAPLAREIVARWVRVGWRGMKVKPRMLIASKGVCAAIKVRMRK